MQWNDSVNAGFSAAKAENLYISLDSSADRPTAEKEMNDENSLRSEVKKLIAFRQQHTALQSKAGIKFVTESGYPLVYERENDDEKLLVIVNASAEKAEFKYKDKLGEILYINGGEVAQNGETVQISGQTAAVVKIGG